MSADSPTIAPERAEAPEIPEHELLRPIASGAYGQVWLGRNAVGTLRAVKIVRRDRFEWVEDFEREFRGLQRFEPVSRMHEGLVDILQIGREESWFYYVMELADGTRNPKSELKTRDTMGNSAALHPQPPEFYSPRTLRAELKARGALTPQEVITFGQRLAAALAHLHGRDLVHRDVKPSNILFVNGQPKLADAGLVTAVDDARSLVGTPGYIPPEGPGTVQADIYSLGKVLYEAAFGKDRHEFPQLPPDLATRTEQAALLELNEIIAKACAQDPKERYLSAEALLAELNLLSSGGSVRQARRVARVSRSIGVGAIWGTAGLVLIMSVLIGLKLAIVAKPEIRKRSPNKAAQDAYDVGRRYLLENDAPGINKASTYFQQAIAADTHFASAWAALAVTWCYSGVGTNGGAALLPRVKETAERALALDRNISEAHLALAWHAALWEWNWSNAIVHFERAQRLEPNNPRVHEWYGVVLGLMGRSNDAVAHLEKAVDLDPISPAYIRHLGLVLLEARRYTEALAAFEKCVKIQPTSENLAGLEEALERAGQIDRAIEVALEADKLNGLSPEKAGAEAEELRRA